MNTSWPLSLATRSSCSMCSTVPLASTLPPTSSQVTPSGLRTSFCGSVRTSAVGEVMAMLLGRERASVGNGPRFGPWMHRAAARGRCGPGPVRSRPRPDRRTAVERQRRRSLRSRDAARAPPRQPRRPRRAVRALRGQLGVLPRPPRSRVGHAARPAAGRGEVPAGAARQRADRRLRRTAGDVRRRARPIRPADRPGRGGSQRPRDDADHLRAHAGREQPPLPRQPRDAHLVDGPLPGAAVPPALRWRAVRSGVAGRGGPPPDGGGARGAARATR